MLNSLQREIGDGTGALGFDRRITITNADGGKTEYYFDATNQRSWKVNPEDWTSDNSNPSVPKTYSAIDPDPNDKARVGDTWNADDNETKIDYDPVTGLPLVITDPLGRTTTYTYNSQGQVTSVTDDANNTITYTYAVNGIDLLTIKDPDNNTLATFTYGSNHEVLTATDAYNNTTTYTYKTWGDVATIEDANGIFTEYNYNTDRLITKVEVDNLTTSSMTYDAKLRLHTATDGDGITLTYDYDDSDRVNKITYPDTTFEEYEYQGDTSLVTYYPTTMKLSISKRLFCIIIPVAWTFVMYVLLRGTEGSYTSGVSVSNTIAIIKTIGLGVMIMPSIYFALDAKNSSTRAYARIIVVSASICLYIDILYPIWYGWF